MSTKKYIRINRKSLEVSVGPHLKDETSILVGEEENQLLNEDFSFAYFNVLYGITYSKQSEADKGRVHYKLVEPDPWLIAVIALMAEGVLQGLSWDVIKAFVLSALSVLRREGLAPYASSERSSTSIGFSWTRYSEEGEPLEELFLGVKREVERKNAIRRNQKPQENKNRKK